MSNQTKNLISKLKEILFARLTLFPLACATFEKFEYFASLYAYLVVVVVQIRWDKKRKKKIKGRNGIKHLNYHTLVVKSHLLNGSKVPLFIFKWLICFLILNQIICSNGNNCPLKALIARAHKLTLVSSLRVFILSLSLSFFATYFAMNESRKHRASSWLDIVSCCSNSNNDSRNNNNNNNKSNRSEQPTSTIPIQTNQMGLNRSIIFATIRSCHLLRSLFLLPLAPYWNQKGKVAKSWLRSLSFQC